MNEGAFSRLFEIHGRDFTNAGRVSTEIKDLLKRMGIHSTLVRRAAIAAYEAEMNVVMYARHAMLVLTVTPSSIVLEVADEGPGISDVELAMQEGYSTATAEMREMGFGAGMGLPNIRRNSDAFTIDSMVGNGARLNIAASGR